jgi:YesN/AraC family two-component response regulator
MKILEFTLPVPENKSITIKEEKLPYFYPYLHRHNEVQLTWIIKGDGTLVAGNNMHNFHSNEIYWIGANQPHVFKSDRSYFENSGIKTHSIDIFFNIDGQLSPFFSIPELKQLKQFISQHKHGFIVPKGKVVATAERMKKVSTTQGAEQIMHFVDMLNLLSSMDTLTVLSTESQSVVCNDNEGIRISTVYNYIMQNYKEPITLDQISKLAYMTPQAFCRYFKKHTHNTLVGFVNQVRINEACKQLMENHNDTIASIAYNTGFNSITNFNRIFKSVLKKSPKEYLESYMRQVS